MSDAHSATIARNLGLPKKGVSVAVRLLLDGNTLPFIARYRKEATGSLDEVALQRVEVEMERIRTLDQRKSYILQTLQKQNLLTNELANQIQDAPDSTVLEDLYLPFKKKRTTRAEKARSAGLGPLADGIWKQSHIPINQLIEKHTISSLGRDDAIAGAKGIIAERISELPWIRQKLRQDFLNHAWIKCKSVPKKEAQASKYQDYFDYRERLKYCPSHRYLAICRGEKEGLLKVRLLIDKERSLAPIRRKLIRRGPLSYLMDDCVEEAYQRLLAPSLENEARKHYKEQADLIAIDMFGKNLKQLLLAPPLGQKSVLAIDPGFRTGCKVVVLDKTGELLDYSTIFPHPPQKDRLESKRKIENLLDQFRIQNIAVGNGTAGRETKDFLNDMGIDEQVEIYMVNENGASIYSASDIARQEFPSHDLTVRGAVSIGRRLMDPLAELVKIDPKSIGVGQYQHDVNPKLLQQRLGYTVQSCVNAVGVNLNTASPYLLEYISGLGKVLAQKIVAFRSKNGAFTRRSDLLKINGLGNKAFEQSAGFLRIREGDSPLDNTGIHPESYPVVKVIAKSIGATINELLQDPRQREKINTHALVEDGYGLPTIRDILNELEKPGLDPRGEAEPIEFNHDIRYIEDLKEEMVLVGMVTNLTLFGAFVDIGIKENGLIHKSQMGQESVQDPSSVLQLGQTVKVKILKLDLTRSRIHLRLLESL